MLTHIIRKEILDQLLSLRYIILSSLGALAIWLSLYDGYSYYQARVRDYQFARMVTEERFQQILGAPNWTELSLFGFKEHKSPTPISIFVRGLDPTLGRSISNSDLMVRRLRWSPGEIEPLQRMFPSLDLGRIVQFVLSLFVLLLTYDAVCGEKDAGTLRLIASFRMPRHSFLLGKLVGILIPLLTAFGLPLLLGTGLLLTVPQVQISNQEWLRLILIFLTFAIYLAVFACAGLLASCLAHRPPTSFVLLLLFWVATVVIIPRLSLTIADTLRPALSIPDHHAEKKFVADNFGIRRDQLHQQFLKEHPEFYKTPESREERQIYYWKISDEMRMEVRKEHERLDEAFRNRYNSRTNLALALARFSPAFAFKNSVVLLAGTGIDRHQRFETAFSRDYFLQYSNWEATTLHLDLLSENHPDKYGRPRRDFSKIPRFDYRETWPLKDLQISFVDLGLLAMWGLIFFSGAFVAMLRYDQR